MPVSVHVAGLWALTLPINSDMCVRRWRTAGRKISCCLNKRDQPDAGVVLSRGRRGWLTHAWQCYTDDVVLLTASWNGVDKATEYWISSWCSAALYIKTPSTQDRRWQDSTWNYVRLKCFASFCRGERETGEIMWPLTFFFQLLMEGSVEGEVCHNFILQMWLSIESITAKVRRTLFWFSSQEMLDR